MYNMCVTLWLQYSSAQANNGLVVRAPTEQHITNNISPVTATSAAGPPAAHSKTCMCTLAVAESHATCMSRCVQSALAVTGLPQCPNPKAL